MIANIKRERRELREQIESYQQEFEQNNNRRIRYVRDIAPIDGQYRRYKELKVELQRYEEMLNRWINDIYPINLSNTRSNMIRRYHGVSIRSISIVSSPGFPTVLAPHTLFLGFFVIFLPFAASPAVSLLLTLSSLVQLPDTWTIQIDSCVLVDVKLTFKSAG